MKVIKIFNNNAVASFTDDNKEVILTGSGIGFKKRVGDPVEKSRIEKWFYCEDGERSPMYQLLARTPSEFFDVSSKIVEEASRRLNINFKDQIIVALTDHISFAIERKQNNITLPNLVLPEISSLYRKEYQIGLWAIDLIKKELNIELSEDEAGYIALHILNGSLNQNASATIDTLSLINNCVKIIEDNYNTKFNVDSIDYIRLTTHLKFMAQRIFNPEEEKNDFNDEDMFDFLKNKEPKVYNCVIEIKNYIYDNFKYNLERKELLYLMIHIHKITN